MILVSLAILYKGSQIILKVQSSSTIKELRALISEKLGLEETKINLLFGGQPLESETATLFESEVTNDSIVEVIEKDQKATVDKTPEAVKKTMRVVYKGENGEIKKRVQYNNYQQFRKAIASTFFPGSPNLDFQLIDSDGFEYDEDSINELPDGSIIFVRKTSVAQSATADQEIELVLMPPNQIVQKTTFNAKMSDKIDCIKKFILEKEKKEEKDYNVILYTRFYPIPDIPDNMDSMHAFYNLFFLFFSHSKPMNNLICYRNC